MTTATLTATTSTATPAEVTATDITPAWVIQNWNVADYAFGHVPRFIHHSADRAAEGEAAFNTFSDLRTRIRTALSQEMCTAINNWDATTRYKELRAQGYGMRVASKPRYMWGAINSRKGCGAGVVFYSCSGHGGMAVSDSREFALPEVFRRGGLYEEDCDIAIVLAFFEDVQAKTGETLGEAVETLVTWFARDCMKFLGWDEKRLASLA